MLDQTTNTTDATRGASLAVRVMARKQELERELAKLSPDDRARPEIERALNEVSGLLTGDLEDIPHVVAAQLNKWLESNKHVNEVVTSVVIPPSPPQRLRSYDELVAFLVAKNVPHQADPSSFAVQIASQLPALPEPVYVRWDQRIPYIHVIQPIGGPVPEDRVQQLETAISHINDVAMIPGYGFSYATKVLYYRLMVPVYEDGVSSDALHRAITEVLNNAVQLEPALKKVVEGAIGATVLDYLTAHN